ncbi:MAG: hypothetical protein K8T91_25005 [Planctomycetes bacterium]|nr:hypothetical protein [Planctomycetota bacterium]
MDTWVSMLIGAGLVSPLAAGVGYLVRFKLEKRSRHISLDLEGKLIENAKKFVELHHFAKERGYVLQPDLPNVKFQDESHLPVDDVLSMWNLALQVAYHGAMRLEEVWSEHPEYVELLHDSQDTFQHIFEICSEIGVEIKPPSIAPVLQAYDKYCRNPAGQTALAVGDALENVDWAKFDQEMKEMSQDGSDSAN